MSLKHYQGGCHCGAVTFQLASATIERGVRCNCSMCKRKGALMSAEAYAPDDIQISVQNDQLACYEFGSHVAKHYFCKNCGIYTFHQTLRKPGFYRVNLGTIDEVDVFTLPFDVFDGASL